MAIHQSSAGKQAGGTITCPDGTRPEVDTDGRTVTVICTDDKGPKKGIDGKGGDGPSEPKPTEAPKKDPSPSPVIP